MYPVLYRAQVHTPLVGLTVVCLEMARTKQTAIASGGAIRFKQNKKVAKDTEGTAADSDGSKAMIIKGRKRRWRSGTVALREIRKLSRSTIHVIPKACFYRLVREITHSFSSQTRYTKSALQAIQEASEHLVTERFLKADIARRHAKRLTLHVNDIKFSEYMVDHASGLVGNSIGR